MRFLSDQKIACQWAQCIGPPNSTKENDVLVNKLLVKMSLGRSHILVVGDFNHPVLKWADEISPKDGDHPSSKFMEAVRDSFLVQRVKKPTHFPKEQTQFKFLT